MQRHPLLIVLAVGLLLPCANASAQPPSVVYETFLPGYELPNARDVVVDEQGNAFLIGSAHADGVHLDVLIFKLDPLGHELWSRSIEASDHDHAADLALDSDGDLWVTGWTDSPDFPVVDPMDDTLTGFRDVFLMKLASADGTILYSTFLGGDYADWASGMAIDAADAIYLTGVTGSTDFPTTTNAYQPGPSFPLYVYQDAFLTKLSSSGDEIVYSTYFGGTQDDWGEAVALDADGNIVIAGTTNADDFPLANAIQTAPDDLFVSKLSADGSTLLFSTYHGGTDVDRLSDLAVDASGDAYLVGPTRSIDYPTSPGAFQETFVGAINGCEVPFAGAHNCEDFYVTKLSTTGTGLLWSTFLGGTTVDETRSVATDGTGNVYVAGYTNSADFPLVGANPGAKMVVCKLSADGSTLDYTYGIESGSANRGNGITVDDAGSVYFSGTVGVPASLYVSKLQGSPQITATEEDVTAGRAGLVLGRNAPNPFNPTTTITYAIPEGAGVSAVDLIIFDVQGRRVRQLVHEAQPAGRHSITWRGRDDDGSPVSAGVYFYRLRWGSETLSRAMVMIE